MPSRDGQDIPINIIQSSMEQTTTLMIHTWQALSSFEESCATSLSDLIVGAASSENGKYLSASIHFSFKVEMCFKALDEVDKLTWAEKQTRKLDMSLEENLQIDLYQVYPCHSNRNCSVTRWLNYFHFFEQKSQSDEDFNKSIRSWEQRLPIISKSSSKLGFRRL